MNNLILGENRETEATLVSIPPVVVKSSKFTKNNRPYDFTSWDGGYDKTGNAHGCGVLVDEHKATWQCTLQHAHVYGSYLVTELSGRVFAGVCSANGHDHGTRITINTDGRITLNYYQKERQSDGRPGVCRS